MGSEANAGGPRCEKLRRGDKKLGLMWLTTGVGKPVQQLPHAINSTSSRAKCCDAGNDSKEAKSDTTAGGSKQARL